MTAKQEAGRRGEALAEAHLVRAGYTVLDRNYRFLRGELDLVCLDDPFVVFVEVKWRSDDAWGRPEEHVTPAQKAKLRETAAAWMHERRMDGFPARFDIVAVLERPQAEPELTHYKFAFR